MIKAILVNSVFLNSSAKSSLALSSNIYSIETCEATNREDVEKSVVLVTGKVEVTASNGESVRILPNDRFRQSTDKYVVDKVNVEDYVSWKEGRLSFKNTELGGILKQLSRYYNVRIDYDKQQQITCSGKLNLDDTIEQILNTITETAPVVISKENNVYKVTIKKK